MAGNKALEKYKKSKIPKKGKGKVIIEIPIYKEPNTQSTIIGRIKKNQEITWISKSICDDREWIRCDKKNNYGYIVGYENSDKCNLDIGTIKEDKSEPKKEYGIDTKKEEIKPLTKEEIELGNEALKEILNDENVEWDKNYKDDNNESKTDNSTEIDENNKSDFLELINNDNEENKIIRLDEEELSDYYFGDDISKIDIFKKENDRLMNEIKCKMGKGSKNKKKKDKKDKKNNNDNDDNTDKEIPFSEEVSKMFNGFEKDEREKIEKILNDDRTVEFAFTLNEESRKKIEQNLKEEKNKKKKNEGGKKNKKEEKNKQHVIINGEILPLDYTTKLADRETVLKEVLKACGLPEDAKYKEKRVNYARDQIHYQPGTVYIYEKIVNGKPEDIEVRDDEKGHLEEGNYYLPPHFNALGKHFFYLWKNSNNDDEKDK